MNARMWRAGAKTWGEATHRLAGLDHIIDFDVWALELALIHAPHDDYAAQSNALAAVQNCIAVLGALPPQLGPPTGAAILRAFGQPARAQAAVELLAHICNGGWLALIEPSQALADAVREYGEAATEWFERKDVAVILAAMWR